MTVAGEIIEGFKITEVGELPYDWGVTTIDSLNKEDKESINPMQYPSEIFEYYSIPAYQDNKTPMLTKGIEILSQKLLLKRGTVLFGKLNPRVEKVWIVKSESSHRKIGSTEWLPILPNKNVADSDFIYYLSWSDYVMSLSKTLVAGSTPSRQRVDPQSFYKIKVPLPPLPEQQKIVSVLSTIQEAKEKTENVIRATKELKKSMTKHLFTYGPVPVENAEKMPLKETERGMIPTHWVYGLFGGFITLQRGFDLPKQDRHGGRIPIISSSGISGFHDIAKLKGPGVVTGRYGTLGEAFYIETDYWPLNTTLFVKDFHGNNPKFVAYYLQTLNLGSFNDKTSVPGINRNHVHGLKVALPPLHEQQQIAESLSAIDDKINAEQTNKTALDTLFKTLLSLLMTGKLRVKDLEIPV